MLGGQPPFGPPPEGIFEQLSADTWFVTGLFLKLFNLTGLRVGGDTWFASVLPELAGFGAIAEKPALNYLMKSTAIKTDRAVFSA